MTISEKEKEERLKKKRRKFRTLPWGWIFMMLIPVYAVIYYTLAEHYIDFGRMGYSLLSCIYLSVTTVTTLGLGDISPITDEAAVLIASECILGVIFAGLFLNAIAFRKSEAASDEKEHDNDIEKYDYECKKMLQFCKVIDVTLDHYEASLLYLMDDGVKSIDNISENMSIKQMPHIFDKVFSGYAEHASYTRVYHFMQLNDDTVNAIRQLIREINMEYWPDFEALCLDFVDHMSDLRIEDFFMKLEESVEKVNKWQSSFDGILISEDDVEELRKTHLLTIDDETIFTPFMDLRDMVVHAASFIRKFHSSVAEITQLDPETIVKWQKN